MLAQVRNQNLRQSPRLPKIGSTCELVNVAQFKLERYSSEDSQHKPNKPFTPSRAIPKQKNRSPPTNLMAGSPTGSFRSTERLEPFLTFAELPSAASSPSELHKAPQSCQELLRASKAPRKTFQSDPPELLRASQSFPRCPALRLPRNSFWSGSRPPCLCL